MSKFSSQQKTQIVQLVENWYNAIIKHNNLYETEYESDEELTAYMEKNDAELELFNYFGDSLEEVTT